jgi:hypothetical protein
VPKLAWGDLWEDGSSRNGGGPVTPTKLRSGRVLKIGGVALSTFGTVGGIVGAIERDLFEALLGFADVILGGVFYVHTKAAER